MREEVVNFIIKYFEKKKTILEGRDIKSIRYLEEGFVDSLGLMKFIVALEEQFEVEITEQDMEHESFYSVAGLVNCCANKVVEK